MINVKSDPSNIADNLMNSKINKDFEYDEYIRGVEYIKFIKGLLKYSDEELNNLLLECETLLKDLYKLGAKNVILTGVEEDNKIGASSYDGKNIVIVLKEKQPRSYHGTGDLFSSIVIANILNGANMKDTLEAACNFVIDSIKATVGDDNHKYGVKFEDVLNARK